MTWFGIWPARTRSTGMIENEQFVSSPELTVDRLVEGADTLVAIGNGETTHRGGTVAATDVRFSRRRSED